MAARIALIAVVIGLGVIGLAMPGDILVGGACWLAFLFFVLAGWGYLAARAARIDEPDFGLRVVWGIAAYLAVAGVLLAAGICSRPFVLGLIAIGVAGFAWRELVMPVASADRIRDAVRYARAQPAVAILIALLVVVALFHLLAAVAQLDRNPWDDDIAYTPLLKRLLDIGDLDEPFSFRRLGAYGGQTILQALGGARGELASVHMIDRGLCQGVVLLLIAGYARELKRVHGVWLGLVVLVVLLLPDNSINTASYWSGFALFLGLYRTIVLAPRAIIMAALVGAATCTLRQNYIAVVVLLLVFALAFSRRDRRTWLVCAAVGAIVLVQYAIAAYSASETFLFPFWSGTWNDAIPLRPTGTTWLDRIQYLITVCINSPLVIIAPLAILLAFARDERPAKPLTAMFAASSLGFLLLALSFLGTEPFHLWRYAFGFAAALLVVFALEVGGTEDAPPVRLPVIGRWMLLAALLLQVAVDRGAIAKRYVGMAADMREARASKGDPNARVEAARYRAMQARVPGGARLAVMVDDPAFLDFARNDILNLDTPGFASPAPGLPAFHGPDALRAYFLQVGVRYVAFVRSDASRYFYRRPFWVWRIFNDSEMFQVASAYAIDMIDSLAELTTMVPVLHDKDGLVVVDLGAQRIPLPKRENEVAVRELFMRRLAESEGLLDAWSLTSRSTVHFEDGFTGLQFVDERAGDPTWTDVARPEPEQPKRGTAVKWMYRRSHLRLRGGGPMRLVLRGKVNLAALNTRPRLDVSLDGDVLGSAYVDSGGRFTFEATVTPRDGWRDLYLVWSAVAQPERDGRELRVARLEEVVWEAR